MVLMALNVTSVWLIRVVSPTGPLTAIAVPSLLAAIFVALLVTIISERQGELVRPQLGRP
jgi:hypothetical protein